MKSIYSDFADELLDNVEKNKDYILNKKKHGDLLLTHVEILRKNKNMNKEIGNYYSLDFDTLNDEAKNDKISNLLLKTLHRIYKIGNNDKILIVGLGNSSIVADSLGPNVADKIFVTNHLFKLYPKKISKGIRKVSVFTPKVMGQTGLESSDLIKAIAKLYEPTLVIIIDSLASSSVKRINKVLQINDIGISPGSGVGNFRKKLNEKFLKIPVIAIGVATVVSSRRIVEETLQQYFEKTKGNIQQKVLNEILSNDVLDMVVTPKEIDEEIDQLSTIIAKALNNFIHYNYQET